MAGGRVDDAGERQNPGFDDGARREREGGVAVERVHHLKGGARMEENVIERGNRDENREMLEEIEEKGQRRRNERRKRKHEEW